MHSSNANAHTVTVTRVNGTTLETTVRCDLTGCSSEKNSGTIQLLPNQTPASTITLNDCLPITADTIGIVATNPLSGVRFQWENVQPMIAESTPSSQRIVYPVSGVTDFTVTLITQGGCNVSQTTRKVHRKLSDNVKLQVLDNCLSSKIPFRVVTEPPLIGVPLRWMLGQSDYTVELIDKNRQDRVSITRDKSDSAIVNITVMDTYCRGGIFKRVSISEAYTGMTMRTEAGVRVAVGGKVPSGTKIIFTAPRHSSITGLYGWSTSIDGGLSKFWEGPAEATVTAPNSGSLTVSVSYTSCFGQQSKTYRLQAANGYCTLLEE